jgi:hypothetical protein
MEKRGMRIVDFKGSYQVDQESDIDIAMARRYGEGFNEFFIYREGPEFPHLAVPVRADVATIFFFPENGHPGFRALRAQDAMGGATDLLFYIGDFADSIQSPAEFIVPVTAGVAVAKSFLRTGAMSPILEWLEL